MSRFSISTLIHADERHSLYRAYEGEELILLKTCRSVAAGRVLATFARDFRIAQDCAGPHLLRGQRLEALEDGSMAQVRDHFDGVSLEELLRERMSPGAALGMLIGLLDALHALHGHGLVHRDVQPANFLYDAATDNVTLVDCSEAVEFADRGSPKSSERTAYDAPELSAATPLTPDRRSDFYGLGVIAYRALTGELPQKMPLRPPSELADGVPSVVSEIVLKLLARDPEQRYQTASGIRRDLSRCLEQWQGSGTVTPFELAEFDHSGKLRFPTRLYGQVQVRDAVHIAARAASDGNGRLIVLSGEAGSGKSALLSELAKSAGAADALVLSGKWDQYQQDTAYSGLIKACVELVERARTLPRDQQERLSASLQKALGTNAGILLELVPELSELLPDAPPIVEVAPGEHQKRVAYCFSEFFSALGGWSRPVWLFLEDIHWADTASRNIISTLPSAEAGLRLLSVVTTRATRTQPARELEELLVNITSRGRKFEHHTLQPMSHDDVGEFVSDTLEKEKKQVEALSSVLCDLAQGNPFTLREILLYLNAQGTLTFDAKLGQWVWDLEQIGPTSVPYDVADLLILRLQELSQATRHTLQVASCIADRFDLDSLAALSNQSLEQTLDALEPCAELGLVMPIRREQATASTALGTREFAFRHDRIRQAAYGDLEPAERARCHGELGKRLLTAHRSSPALPKLLEAVGHLNRLPSNETNEDLATLNLEASLLAKRAGAHGTAAALLRVACEQLGEDPWASGHETTFRIVIERAEAEYLANRPEVAQRLFDEVLAHAKTDVQRLEALEKRVQVRASAGHFEGAAADSLECLKLLGVPLPEHPSKGQVLASLLFVVFKHRRFESRVELAKEGEVDAKSTRIMACLANLWGTAFWSNEALTGLVVLKLLRYSLDVGNTSVSSIAYASYAVFLSEALGKARKGWEVCRLGLRLAEQANDPVYLYRVRFMYVAFFGHFEASLRDNLDQFRAIVRGHLSAGDYPYAAAAGNMSLYYLPAAGIPFPEARREIATLLALAKQTEQSRALITLQIMERWFDILEYRRPYESKVTLSRDIFVDGAAKYENERGAFYLFELSLCFLLGRTDEALHAAERLRGNKMLSGYFAGYFAFYYGLTLAKVARSRRQALGREFAQCLRTVEGKAEIYPPSYQHKVLILRAVQARAAGKVSKAVALFEKGIELAREEFQHHAAIASELCAECFEELDDAQSALRHLSNARLWYLEWGCLYKVEATDHAHASLVAPRAAPQLAATNDLIPSDLAAVLDAARALSAETDANRISKKLLESLLEHTGATRAALVIADDEELQVEMEASQNSAREVVSREINESLSESSRVPRTLIEYAQRVSASLQLSNAPTREAFSRDPYVASRPGYSFACVPLVWLKRCIGVAFLENEITTRAFSARHIAAAELLSAQAAATLRSAWEHRERLTVLQSKMSPHFLYNALNSIAEMTVNDPEQAESAIVRLADLYRFLTDASQHDAIRLREELDFVASYLQLEKLRFRDRLSYEIQTEGDLDASLIPPLVLQPLVENAVRHGVASQPAGGTVTVSARVSERRVHLRVSDTGSGFGGGTKRGTGIGLSTARTRLQLFFGPDADMRTSNSDGATVAISFPVRSP